MFISFIMQEYGVASYTEVLGVEWVGGPLCDLIDGFVQTIRPLAARERRTLSKDKSDVYDLMTSNSFFFCFLSILSRRA